MKRLVFKPFKALDFENNRSRELCEYSLTYRLKVSQSEWKTKSIMEKILLKMLIGEREKSKEEKSKWETEYIQFTCFGTKRIERF
jgi:hypothetical protein